MNLSTSSHAYGIGLIAVIVGTGVGIAYYQLYFMPEYNASPPIPTKILEPSYTTTISIIPGAENPDQQQNFVPKKVEVQLGVNNLVIWKNTSDSASHTVTPDQDSKYRDPHSKEFGSPGVIMPGKTYQFLFTQEVKIKYHCEPHQWMTGEIDVVQGC